MTEEAILAQAHKDRVATAAFAVGGDTSAIPRDVMDALNEQYRKEVLEANQTKGKTPKVGKAPKASKADKLLAFCKYRTGQPVSLPMLRGASGASKKVVLEFIDTNRSMFIEETEGRRWNVVDVNAARAAEVPA